MKYFSMFSGIGGFELGIKRTTEGKWECIGYSEIDKYAIQTYSKHFKHKNYGDARNINGRELPYFNLLCAGFPCQAFSLAGRRKGFNDTRGTLFFEICRIVKDKKPKYLFLENVKGLLNHENGNTFRTILKSLDELGYDAEWQILNSKHFGVPQNRERVFIIGHLRGESSRQVFPIGEINKINNSKSETQVARTLSSSYYKQGQWEQYINISKRERSKRQLICLNNPDYTKDGEFEMNKRIYSDEGMSPTLQAQSSDDIKIVTHNLQPRSEFRPSLTKQCPCNSGKLYQKCCGVPSGTGYLSKDDGTTYCLDSGNTQAIEIIGGLQANAGKMKNQSTALTEAMGKGGGHTPIVNSIRRLTPIECERLQGFPDGWTKGVSDTQRYKQLGNAVTVNVIENIVKEI